MPLVGSALDKLPLSKFGKFACIPAQLLKGTRLDQLSAYQSNQQWVQSCPVCSVRYQKRCAAEATRRVNNSRAANKFHHSITSSARAKSIGGIVNAERLSGLEIDHQFYLGALLDWEVSRLGALENFSDVDPCLLI